MFILFADLTPASIHEFLNYIQVEKKKWKIPGTVFIGIIYDGKEETHFIGEDIDPQTLMPIASLSKAFTAQIIGALVKRGILKLEDPILKYLPDLKLPHNTPIRIIDILSQRTGLHNFSGDTLLKLGFTPAEIKEKLVFFKVDTKPQVDYSYNNLPIGLLETVIEKVTGKKFDDVAQEYLFKPLHMNTANYTALQQSESWWGCSRHNDHLPNLYLYDKEDSYFKVKPDPKMYRYRASMGLTLTYPDLMKWLKYSMDPSQYNIVSQDFIDSTRSSQASFTPKPHDTQFALKRLQGAVHYGINWFNMMYGEHKIYFHMGAWSGTRSYIMYDPVKRFGIVIWHNCGSIDINMFPEAIRARFLDAAYNYPDHDWVSEIEISKRSYRKKVWDDLDNEVFIPSPSLPFDQLSGIYQSKLYGDIEIVHSKYSLHMKYRGLKIKLKHHNNNKFLFDQRDLSPYLGNGIPQWIVFGQNKDKKMVLQNCFMYEGSEPFFIRK